jgi:type IV secretory pathway VirB10-like protein
LQTSAGDDLSIQNGQSQKESFLNGHIDQAIYSPQRVQTPFSPYQLMAGSVIAAALITGLNSDLPGQVVAQVTEDVYDTVRQPHSLRAGAAAADLDTPRHAGRQLDRLRQPPR